MCHPMICVRCPNACFEFAVVSTFVLLGKCITIARTNAKKFQNSTLRKGVLILASKDKFRVNGSLCVYTVQFTPVSLTKPTIASCPLGTVAYAEYQTKTNRMTIKKSDLALSNS